MTRKSAKELAQLKAYLDNLRSQNKQLKRYPEEFWERCLPLARQYGERFIANELGIDTQNINRRLIGERGPKKPSPKFIEAIPVPTSTQVSVRKVLLELPWGIKLRVEL